MRNLIKIGNTIEFIRISGRQIEALCGRVMDDGINTFRLKLNGEVRTFRYEDTANVKVLVYAMAN